MKIILLGGTGLVGGEILRLGLLEPRITEIIALGRSELQLKHPKLSSYKIDFANLPDDEKLWKGDAILCALGTTIKKAGSQEKFQVVDRVYPLEAGKMAKRHGTKCFVLNSAMGANPESSFFYNRTKGKLEEELKELEFPSLVFVRPGLISEKRKEFRLGEEVGKTVISILTPFLPRKWRMNPAKVIAQTMLEKAMRGKEGVEIVTSEELV